MLFRPNSNITLAIQAIINNIHKYTSKYKPTLAIYIDLTKAYDTISHQKLLHKFKHEFNFSQNTLLFFETFFQNRTQSVHTQHAQSETQIITDGIPQGSTLSTTFFILYINNILNTTTSSNTYIYADDITLIITAETPQELQQLAQTELNKLIKYFYINDLVPNPTKTTYTIFYPQPQQNSPQNIQLHINDKIIENSPQAKLLGIIIQEDRKYHKTVINIIKKLQPIITRFKYANKLLSTQKMKQLYYTHAYPHLIGSITIWGTDKHNKEYMQPLIRTQKKLVRLIKNLPPQTHTKPIMKELKILNIISLYILHTAMEVHPHIYSKENINRPKHDHNYISTAQIHEYGTRQTKQRKFYIPNSNLLRQAKITRQTAKYTAEHLNTKYINIWNTIPINIRENQNIRTFKKELKIYLLKEQSL